MLNLIFIFIISLQTSTAFRSKTVFSTNFQKKKQLFKNFYNPILFKEAEKTKRAINCIYYPDIKDLNTVIYPLRINYIYNYDGKYSFILNKINIQETWTIKKDNINCLIDSKYFQGEIDIYPLTDLNNNNYNNIEVEVDLLLKKKNHLLGNDIIKEINKHIFTIVSICINYISL